MADERLASERLPKAHLEPIRGTLIPATPASNLGDDGDRIAMASKLQSAEVDQVAPALAEQNAESLLYGKQARMDFVMEQVHADDATRTLYTVLKPDPRRYDLVEKDAECYYFDKYLRVALSFKDFLECIARTMPGKPIYMQPPRIDSTVSYAANRLVAVRDELAGGNYVPPLEKPAAHIDPHVNETARALVFVSIDIINATAKRKANPIAFERAYHIFMRELVTVVGQFNGAILKATGDGFIACVDYPAFTTQCDNGVDLGLSLLRVLTTLTLPPICPRS